MSNSSQPSERFGFATGENAAFLEELYAQYKAEGSSIDPSWRRFFEGVDFALGGATAGMKRGAVAAAGSEAGAQDEGRVEAYINAFRRLGHLSADLNPLEPRTELSEDLKPEAHGLGHVAPDRRFHPVNLPITSEMTFAEIVSLMRETYCRKIGADYREINDIAIVTWLQEQMESCRNKPEWSVAQKRRIYAKLAEADGFEKFLHTRYLGQKRFSLEGLDAFVPMMDTLISDAAGNGVEEVIIGMAHRGRLNTLANIMGKDYRLMLKEFEGTEYNLNDIDGDVKYHMGFASRVDSAENGPIHLFLCPNPSHLEAVNPVVEGMVRARQHLLGDKEHRRVMPVLVHGDASFIGQGLVAETLNLAYLDAYSTGGTIHVILNNQVGFTTDPCDSRSSEYASSIAKMIRAPVFHVNADDPEAVAWTAKLAVMYRQKFQRDIVIDIIGYRRHGHNEADEPAFTQPLMYKRIAVHASVATVYQEQLISSDLLTDDEAKKTAAAIRDRLQQAMDDVRAGKACTFEIPERFRAGLAMTKVSREDLEAEVDTGVAAATLKEIGRKICRVGKSGFTPHSKVVRLLETRTAMFEQDGAIDWPMAELLAFSTLANEGFDVRLSGQDCQRGTFSSRHAVIFDTETGEPLRLLEGISPTQGQVDIINSPLSEQGVVGFEFGYSIAHPKVLTMWEAQFGDFVNGCQIIIDQFLVASEAKWKQTTSLVLLLPHGYEGMGPEHSSARPERFLQLCGNLNIQVVNPTTAAQYFHVLRRQMQRKFRKPLIVMTPKSLLRSPLVASSLASMKTGTSFKSLLPDEGKRDAKAVKRVIFCSGKVYYEILAERDNNATLADIPIIRVEQFYPFPHDTVKAELAKYKNATEVVWAQEEPENMGGWSFVWWRLKQHLSDKCTLKYVGRKGSGTTAEGSSKAHQAEQKRIVHDALGLAFNKQEAMSKSSEMANRK